MVNLKLLLLYGHWQIKPIKILGGLQCVPGLYRTYDSWKPTQPENRNRFKIKKAAKAYNVRAFAAFRFDPYYAQRN